MKKLFLSSVLVFLLGLHGLHAALGEDFSLSQGELLKFDDLPQYISAQNLKVEAHELSVEAAETRKGHLRRSFLPTVNIEAGGETFHTEEVGTKSQPFLGAEMEMNLYRGKRDEIKDKILNQKVLFEKEEMKSVAAHELLKARVLYLDLVNNLEHSSLNLKTVAKSEEILKSAKRRIESGLASKTDQLEIQLFLGKLAHEQQELILERKKLKSDLQLLLGVSGSKGWRPEAELALPFAEGKDHVFSPSEFDLENHLEILSLKAKENMLHLDRELNDNIKRPTIDLYTEYSLPTNREKEAPAFKERREAAAGIKLTWNIYDGEKSQTESVSQSLERSALSKILQAKKAELKNEFDQLLEEHRSLKEQIKNMQSNIKLAEEFLESSANEYKRGVKGSLEILEASEKLYELKHEIIKQKRDYHQTRSKILSFLGK